MEVGTMLKSLTTVNVWVQDQDEALAFYTEKLGLELRNDTTLPAAPFATRSLSFEETSSKLKALVAKGAAGGLFFATDDIDGTYSELKGRGVEFSQEPTDQPYGRDAGFRDPSGNQMRLAQLGD